MTEKSQGGIDQSEHYIALELKKIRPTPGGEGWQSIADTLRVFKLASFERLAGPAHLYLRARKQQLQKLVDVKIIGALT